MSENKKDLLNKDELVKSLQDLDFSTEEITAIIEKGEKEGNFEPEEDEDDETVDEAAADKAGKDVDKDEVKKAYDKIVSMKDEIDKAMGTFLDMFGKVPGLTTPKEFVKKSEEDTLEKSEVNDFEKAFGDKFDTIIKGFENQTKINQDLSKSVSEIGKTVEAIATTDKMYKSVFGNYKGAIIEKGERTDDDGKTVYNLGNKDVVNDQFAKAMDKIENEQDKQVVRDLISTYNISGYTNPRGLDIVKKALQIDFEK